MDMNSEEQRRAERIERMAMIRTRREEAQAAGMAALQRLVPVALRDTGQSQAVGRFLLGLYNGPAFPFDLTDLRRLDLELHDDCLAVLRMDHMPWQEVHTYFKNGQEIWARLKELWTTDRDRHNWKNP